MLCYGKYQTLHMNFQRVFEKFHIDLKVIFSYNFSPIDQTNKQKTYFLTSPPPAPLPVSEPIIELVPS